MKPALIGLMSAYAVLGALPCGHVPDLGNADLNTARDVAHTTAKVAHAAIDVGACNRLGDEKVGYDEELSLGGAVAVNFTGNNGGLFLDYTKADASRLRHPDDVKFNDGAAGTKATRYLNTVGKLLAMQSARPDIAWKFGILNNTSAVNALSAPGGYVLITKALAQKVQNEDQLAGVLAHEIGHIVLRHALTTYSTTKVRGCQIAAAAKSDAAADLGDALRGKVDPNGFTRQMETLAREGSSGFNLDQNVDVLTYFSEKVADFIVSVGYDQQQEFEADRVAVDLLVSAGYSVDEYDKFLGTLNGGGAFAHHPAPADRIKAVNEYLASLKSKAKDDPFAAPSGKQRKPVQVAEFATLKE